MEIAFIIGAHKCATSSFAGMLNCNPNILALYEVGLHQAIPSKYGRKLLSAFPEWRQYFGEKDSLVENYNELANELHASLHHHYQFLVDKLPGISVHDMNRMKNCKIFYMVRDVRTWLVKISVKDLYCCRENLAPAAVDYAVCFISSFLRVHDKSVLHIDFNDFLSCDSPVAQITCKFLDVPYAPLMDRWWENVSRCLENDKIKASLDWLSGHQSAMMAPVGQDTAVKLAEHPFWDEFLPIFDFYYHHLNMEIDQSKISEDIETLKKMRATYFLPLHKAFVNIKSETFKNSVEAQHKGGLRSPFLKQVLQRGAHYFMKMSESF